MSRTVSVIRMRKEQSETSPQPEEFFQTVRELLQLTLSLLIEKPEDLFVEIKRGEKTTIFEVKCAHVDLGRILGRQGKMITSVRTIISGMTARHGYRSVIELPYFPRAEK